MRIPERVNSKKYTRLLFIVVDIVDVCTCVYSSMCIVYNKLYCIIAVL